MFVFYNGYSKSTFCQVSVIGQYLQSGQSFGVLKKISRYLKQMFWQNYRHFIFQILRMAQKWNNKMYFMKITPDTLYELHHQFTLLLKMIQHSFYKGELCNMMWPWIISFFEPGHFRTFMTYCQRLFCMIVAL